MGSFESLVLVTNLVNFVTSSFNYGSFVFSGMGKMAEILNRFSFIVSVTERYKKCLKQINLEIDLFPTLVSSNGPSEFFLFP